MKRKEKREVTLYVSKIVYRSRTGEFCLEIRNSLNSGTEGITMPDDPQFLKERIRDLLKNCFHFFKINGHIKSNDSYEVKILFNEEYKIEGRTRYITLAEPLNGGPFNGFSHPSMRVPFSKQEISLFYEAFCSLSF